MRNCCKKNGDTMVNDRRFRYDWRTGRFKDTQSKSLATSNMRILETQINNACYNYEKEIEELKTKNQWLYDDLKKSSEENKQLKQENKKIKKELHDLEADYLVLTNKMGY